MNKILFFLTVLCLVSYSQLTQQWIAVYNGPSGSIDSVRNMVVDNDGNVYITGSSTSANLFDYTALKYNSSGTLLWEARYDGPSNNVDDAQWLAVDNSGNVYVTGYSRSGITSGTGDFATVKFNSSGVLQWAARYNGPGNNIDKAVRVAADNSGNVYVTGLSMGNGTAIDYATIKYNSNGVQQWVARYNGPGNSIDQPAALSIDNSGNVYVTGFSRSTDLYGSEDYLTVKYNPDGQQIWALRFNGSSNWSDAATSIAVDNNGNVFVTGYSYSNTTLNDYVTIKYNASGSQEWISTFNYSAVNGSDMAKMVILDNSGNVYVTGTSGTEYILGYTDYATVKYNSSGVQQWVARYNGPGNATDEPYSIAVDNSGNVYVSGKATMPGFIYDFVTLIYTPNGVQSDEVRFNGAANLNDGATWINTDNNGNVYITGNSQYVNNYSSDFVTIKYSQTAVKYVTGLIQVSGEIPETFKLNQNYPNPFNPVTSIEFGLPERSFVKIRIFSLLGIEVAEILNQTVNAGTYRVNFNAGNIASGAYIYNISTAGFTESKKMILLK